MGLTPASSRDRLSLFLTLLRATAVYCKKRIVKFPKNGEQVYKKVYSEAVKG